MKKRIHEIKIRFSPDEFATLNEQVKKAGMWINLCMTNTFEFSCSHQSGMETSDS